MPKTSTRQTIPVLVDTIDERTWLYRNAALYVRTPSGHFTRQEPQRKPKKIDLKPSDFSSATRQSLTDPGPISSCVRSLSRTECENILSIQKFERLTFSRSLWHGFLQARKNPVSTLSPDGGPVWALPAQMLAVQDVQLKNWILKYIPAKEKNSTRPVNFELCINSDWKGFYVRTFSPLRNIDAKSIRIFLQD
jgi:hypothetical protein